jgi:hypothetical protein
MKTVATFTESYKAHLAKGRLEAEGISSIVVSGQLEFGGGKVQVAEADFERAEQILKEDYTREIDALDQEGLRGSCPKCGSVSILYGPDSESRPTRSFLSDIVRFFQRKKWKCVSCGAKW